MQTKLAKILIILIICILTMGDVIAIAENLTVMPILEEQSEEIQIDEGPEILELRQTLIASKEYKIGDVTKKIVQLSLEVNANNLQTSTLKENQITLTTPIEGVSPEEIYISEQNRANFIDATWEYNENNLIIRLENDEIERNKESKIDTLILTYVYADSTDVSKISTKVEAEGKLYNGKKAISEESICEVESVEEFGEIIQISSNIQEIYRTELQKENQEFFEISEINFSYKNTDIVNKITLTDKQIQGYKENGTSEIATRYIATLINKQELLNAIGEEGTIIIKSEEKELIKIDKNTETDDNGNILINYEEEISKITIEVVLGEYTKTQGKIENGKFNIINQREIEKCEENEAYEKQVKTIDVSLAKDEKISGFKVESIGEIKNKVTKAELGLNKHELTSAQENELIATITMHTENKKYDLNQNPVYEIVLPQEVEKAELGNITILNNKDFKVKENQIVENNNGQNVVVVELEGKQTEYVEEVGNVQIIVPLKVTMTKLIPTTKTNVELYYTNENAESYEAAENFGKEAKEINIIADTDLIVATEAKIGEAEVMSYKTDIANLSMKKTENMQIVEIKGTIINNTDSVKENLEIIGENELLSEVTTTKGNVYYSETEEGPWADTFSEGQKYFKIEIEKLDIGEKLEFTCNMQIPEVLEESKNYDAAYKVFEGENLSKESKLQVAVEVEPKVEEPEEEEPEVSEGKVEINYESKITKYGGYEIENVETDSYMVHEIYINNYTQEDKNLEIKIKIPECIDTTNLKAYLLEKTDDVVFETGKPRYEIFSEVEPVVEGNQATYTITAPANSEIEFYLELSVEKYVEKEVITDISILLDGEETKFSDVQTAITPAVLETDIKAYINEKEIKTEEEIKLEKGEQIKYITTVVNKGETKETVELASYNSIGFKRVKMEIYKNNELIKEFGESKAEKFISTGIEISKDDEIKIILILELVSDITETRVIEQFTEINGYLEKVETDKIITKLLKNVEEPEKPEEPQEPEKPQEPIIPEEPVANKYSISGIAWLDKNKDGEQDELEDYLNGIEVSLLNSSNEKIATVITDMNGKYEFKDLESGKYVVVFGYNTATYNLTAYKKAGVLETKNSDGILTTQDGVNVAKTEVLEITNNDISNIDIGFTLKEIFDLEVTKQIKKVTIKNEAGQTAYECQNTDFTKIEIPSKYFKGTNIIVEYEVQIVNKGDISGYVKTLTDHKPEGLKFASELNTSWYEGTDGKLYCIEFGEDEIKPGETREVSLVLTKQITDTKVQYITNEVELEEVFNEYLTIEKDTSNNKAEATLIVAIKTGAVKTYLGLWLACAIILSTGMYLIKDKVINKR